MNSPFFDLRVFCDGLSTTVVSWELDPRFPDPLPYTFELQFAPAETAFASNEYQILVSGVGVTTLVDTVMRGGGLLEDSYYRVRLTTPLGSYDSEIKGAVGNVSTNNIPLLRELRRKEALALRKDRGAIPGYLFKRRTYGPKCKCHDKNTGEMVGATCPDCAGSGFVGGYFPAVPYTLLLQSPEVREVQRSNIGTADTRVLTARCQPVPEPQSKDVWMEADTTKAYEIRKYELISRLSFQPVAGQLEMRQLAQADTVAVLINALLRTQVPTQSTLPPGSDFGKVTASNDLSNGMTVCAPADVPIIRKS